MATKSYEIDSNGDVLLILRNPRPSFAVWDETEDFPSSLPDPTSRSLVDEVFIPKPALTKKNKRRRKRAPVPVDEPEPEIPPEHLHDPLVPVDSPLEALEDPLAPRDSPPELLDGPPEFLDALPQAIDDPPQYNETGSKLLQHRSRGPETLDCVTIQVSSRHLMLASPYFSRMLKGKWKEGNTIQTTGFVSVEVEDVDADALVILMDIIHGRTRSVPKAVDLETLAKMAVLVDLYECAEVVEIFTDMWIAHLQTALPSVYSRDAVLWICISWVFRQHDAFRSATSAALKYSNGPIQPLGLPIPSRVVDDIDQQRQESIEGILIALRGLAKDLIKDLYGCSFECRCMLLGALVKAMDARNLSFSQPATPFIGFNFAHTLEYVRNVRSPGSCWNRRGYYSESLCDCSLRSCIDSVIGSLKNRMDGLLLQEYLLVS